MLLNIINRLVIVMETLCAVLTPETSLYMLQYSKLFRISPRES